MQDLFSKSTAEFYPPDTGQEQLDQIAEVQQETEQKIAELRPQANEGQEEALAEIEMIVNAANARVEELQAERKEAREQAKKVVAFKTASARQALIRVSAHHGVTEWYKDQARALWHEQNDEPAEEGEEPAEPTDEQLSETVISQDVFVEYQLRLVAASLGSAVDPTACQNFDLPRSVDDWLDLPEDVFNACCDACWRCNPTWRPGWQRAGGPEKNAFGPG